MAKKEIKYPTRMVFMVNPEHRKQIKKLAENEGLLLSSFLRREVLQHFKMNENKLQEERG